MTLKQFNENWSARRRQSIEEGKTLRNNMVQGVFATNVTVVKQQVLNSLQGSGTLGTSNAAALSRLNLLV
ncbi:hypothetical protein [Roseibium aestuarii]|uniref:Uncharacterized protein n=1 Tax=Roseibium aestuarii TaxID=2600299 RepID=A0ABW4JXM0_9HYPH|nr:hypothetical protein [Roseibium aestuarii]